MAKSKSAKTPTPAPETINPPGGPVTNPPSDPFTATDGTAFDVPRGTSVEPAPSAPAEPTPPVPAEPPAPVENPIADVPRGTSGEREPPLPGIPNPPPSGDPEAPWGRKADGTPRAKPGQKPKTEGASVAAKPAAKRGSSPAPVSSEPPAPVAVAAIAASTASPPPPPPTNPLERFLSTDWGNYFGSPEDLKRQERAKANTIHWAPWMQAGVVAGEAKYREKLIRDAQEKGLTKAEAESRLSRVPELHSVRVFQGTPQESDCETVIASSLGTIVGYFVPFDPSHPLFQSTGAIVACAMAYRTACNDALRGSGV